MIEISNNLLLNNIDNFYEFHNLGIINYLSVCFNIHKERIQIKDKSLTDLSDNIVKLEEDEFFILINDTSNNIIINDTSNNIIINDTSNNIIINDTSNNIIINDTSNNIIINDTSNNNYYYLCNNNSNIIINKYCKINYNINNKSNNYIVFKDTCKYMPTKDESILKLCSSINDKKNNIILLNGSNFIDDKDCDYFIKILDNSIDNKDYHIEKWGNHSNVNCCFINVNNIKNDQIRKKVDEKLFNIVNKIINYLFKEYKILSQGDSGYYLRKIFGPTRQHVDGIDGNHQNNKNNYIDKNNIRNMSLIIALNDDYEGGEFYFPNQNFKKKLGKGDIILFPPYWTHPHFVTIPENKTYRYTINTWLLE